MKFARLRDASGTRFAAQDASGWRLLPESIDDTAALSSWSGAPTGEVAPPNLTFVCPIVRPSKVIGIGLNYLDHIRETGADAPSQPVVFAKFPNALTGPYDSIVVDPGVTSEADYEIELAVVIGRSCRAVSSADALHYVFGYAIANDVSPRDLQRTDRQLSWAKSVDGFCPVGPWITTADEIDDPQALDLRSYVNGEARQSSSTAEMLFPVAELIAFLSRTMTLQPGDTILTGTPHGVGFTMSPPQHLTNGDVVRGEIEGLGHIENVFTTYRSVGR